jgi:uncharacterized membrane protein
MPRLRRHTLLIALSLLATAAAAQHTGGRIGGSQWNTLPPPSAASPPGPMFAPPPPPPPAAVPSAATPPPPPAAVPSAATPPPPPMAAPGLPAPPPPPPARIAVHAVPRGAASPGVESLRARDREADAAERAAASPSWSAGEMRGPMRWSYGGVAGALVFAIGVAFTLAATQRRGRGSRGERATGAVPPRPLSQPPADHPGVEIRSVSLAYDARARAALQHQLDALATTVDLSSPGGLFGLGTAARDLLAGAHGAACMGAFQCLACDPSVAQARFQQLADRARGRYTVESVNNARRVAGPAVTPRAEEGAGFVVVTLLVAARGALPDPPTAMDLPSLMSALHGALPARPDRLLALEVIWSPAEDRDRMSSAELVVLYPELLALDPRAALGRKVCASCRGVFARELGRCPACGAA